MLSVSRCYIEFKEENKRDIANVCIPPIWGFWEQVSQGDYTPEPKIGYGMREIDLNMT
jgi:hypothetical protein